MWHAVRAPRFTLPREFIIHHRPGGAGTRRRPRRRRGFGAAACGAGGRSASSAGRAPRRVASGHVGRQRADAARGFSWSTFEAFYGAERILPRRCRRRQGRGQPLPAGSEDAIRSMPRGSRLYGPAALGREGPAVRATHRDTSPICTRGGFEARFAELVAARGPRRVSAQQLEANCTLGSVLLPSRPRTRWRDAVDAVPHPAFDGRRGALPRMASTSSRRMRFKLRTCLRARPVPRCRCAP